MRKWIKTLLIDQAPAVIPGMRKLVEGFDLIATDPMIYPAVIAAEREGVPWVALSNSLNPVLPDEITSELLKTVAWLSGEREQLFAGLGTKFRGCDALSPTLTIAFTTSEFSGGFVEGVEQVGPSKPLCRRGDERDFAWDELNGDPLIYLSFGSQIYHQPELFQKAMEAVRNRPVQLVAAVHDLEFEDVPENVLLCGYAPQLELLEKAAVMITHGGANSVMEALAAGVPLLINPICNDQFHQLWFLEQTGCGREVDLERMSAEKIWETIEWALDAGISKVMDSYQVDGARRAAELIDAL